MCCVLLLIVYFSRGVFVAFSSFIRLFCDCCIVFCVVCCVGLLLWCGVIECCVLFVVLWCVWCLLLLCGCCRV